MFFFKVYNILSFRLLHNNIYFFYIEKELVGYLQCSVQLYIIEKDSNIYLFT